MLNFLELSSITRNKMAIYLASSVSLGTNSCICLKTAPLPVSFYCKNKSMHQKTLSQTWRPTLTEFKDNCSKDDDHHQKYQCQCLQTIQSPVLLIHHKLQQFLTVKTQKPPVKQNSKLLTTILHLFQVGILLLQLQIYTSKYSPKLGAQR